MKASIKVNTVLTAYEKANKEFLKVQSDIMDMLAKSGLKQRHIYTKIGMNPNTWYLKKKNMTFSPEQLQSILKLIENSHA